MLVRTSRFRPWSLIGSLLVLHFVIGQVAPAAASEKHTPRDSRLGPLKDLNGYFPFVVPDGVAEWQTRRRQVVRQMLVACGLWPMPERRPITATVHGRVERDGYSVDRVFFESSPGLYVTGSLYRPTSFTGRRPAILCPYGHYADGRFYRHDDATFRQELASGAEALPIGGRYPLQARCVQLARMGCIVFQYDMQGRADGGSLSNELTHGFKRQREHLSDTEHWGLYSAQAELRLVNTMGLQTWNSLRSLDWIASRDDVDASRIGVTGSSGGGTQTFMLSALDDRVAAAFPAVMVSTAMQGGCTCENACYLRIDTGNVEFAALTAPRPIGMTGANDWTREIETKGLPELKQLYAMLGVPDHVEARYLDFPHNYNGPSRALMYDFFNRHLNLGAESLAERDFEPLSTEEATVFNAIYPAPPHDEYTEIALLRAWERGYQEKLGGLEPDDEASLRAFREVMDGALDVMIGRQLPAPSALEYQAESEQADAAGAIHFTGRLRNTPHGEEIPVRFTLPQPWNRQVVVWVSDNGKGGLTAAGSDGGPANLSELSPGPRRLVEAGFAIAAADLLYQGDFLPEGRVLTETRRVENGREYLGYTLGYNRPLMAQRVHDVCSLLAFVLGHESNPDGVHIVGVDGGAPVAVLATWAARHQVRSLAVATEKFRFEQITKIRDPRLLPGAVKYGDLPAMMGLCAPVRLCVASEPVPPKTASLYAVAGGVAEHVPASTQDEAVTELVEWLVTSLSP